MKPATRTVYQHFLLAPKGYIFNLEVIKATNIFHEDNSLELRNKGKSLHWEDTVDFVSNIPEEWWDEHFTVENGILVKEND